MDWVLGGDLEWTFDLRRAGARRSCLRILTESIVRLRQRHRPLTPARKSRPAPPPFPARSSTPCSLTANPFCSAPNWPGSGLAAPATSTTSSQDGLLGLVDKHYEPCEAVQIRRETVFDFMQSRRII